MMATREWLVLAGKILATVHLAQDYCPTGGSMKGSDPPSTPSGQATAGSYDLGAAGSAV